VAYSGQGKFVKFPYNGTAYSYAPSSTQYRSIQIPGTNNVTIKNLPEDIPIYLYFKSIAPGRCRFSREIFIQSQCALCNKATVKNQKTLLIPQKLTWFGIIKFNKPVATLTIRCRAKSSKAKTTFTIARVVQT